MRRNVGRPPKSEDRDKSADGDSRKSPAALARIGYTPERWRRQVLAVGSDYYRAIGAAEALVDKAAEIGQKWLRGIGIARHLTTMRG